MGIEGGAPYNPEDAIQSIIDNGNPPAFEEESTTNACVEIERDDAPQYTGESDFEPILTPTFDENGNQT